MEQESQIGAAQVTWLPRWVYVLVLTAGLLLPLLSLPTPC